MMGKMKRGFEVYLLCFEQESLQTKKTRLHSYEQEFTAAVKQLENIKCVEKTNSTLNLRYKRNLKQKLTNVLELFQTTSWKSETTRKQSSWRSKVSKKKIRIIC